MSAAVGAARLAGVLAGGAVAGALLALAVAAAGPLAALVPFAAVLFGVLVSRPRLALAVLVGSAIVVEGDAENFLTLPEFYSGLPGPLRPPDLLLLAALGAVAVDHARRRRPVRLPGPFTLPLLLMATAIVAGLVTGFAAEPDMVDLANAVRRLLYLLLIPLVVVDLLEDERDLRAALVFAAALAGYKVLTGLIGFALGEGRQLGGTVLAYYAPLPNLLMLLVVLTVLAAALARVRLPPAAWWLAPAALLVLVVGFRRNWWIAAVLGMVLVALVATGRRTRELLLPVAALMGVALWLGFTALSSSNSNSPLVERARSLSPSRLQTDAYDRYRLDEQRNVIAEIEAHPVTGLGLGVPWRVRYPLAVSFPNGQDYTHVVVFWYWLKLGLLGVLAYVAILATAAATGMRVWRRAHDGVIRAAGLALAAGVAGLAVAETTGSFTGVELRLTIVLGAALGWLAAAALATEPPAHTATGPPAARQPVAA